MTRKLSRYSIFLTALLLGSLLAPPPVGASEDASCSYEEGIFYGAHNGGGFVLTAQGQWTFNRLSLRDVNESCSGRINVAGSTAHLSQSSSILADYVEVGWELDAGQYYRWFIERKFNGIDVGSYGFFPPECPPHANQYYEWRVTYQAAGNTFTGYVKCPGDTSFRQLGGAIGTASFQQGIPETETFRRGGTKTGMSDDRSIAPVPEWELCLARLARQPMQFKHGYQLDRKWFNAGRRGVYLQGNADMSREMRR